MGIKKIQKLEQNLIKILNNDGWNLVWSGKGFSNYDAIGFTKKGFKCIIEMKFRNKYYKDKMLEKFKYNKLMQIEDEIIKLYFVNDPKGNYIFILNDLVMPKPIEMYCPDTTIWTKKRLLKPVYLLKEKLAIKLKSLYNFYI